MVHHHGSNLCNINTSEQVVVIRHQTWDFWILMHDPLLPKLKELVLLTKAIAGSLISSWLSHRQRGTDCHTEQAWFTPVNTAEVVPCIHPSPHLEFKPMISYTKAKVLHVSHANNFMQLRSSCQMEITPSPSSSTYVTVLDS